MRRNVCAGLLLAGVIAAATPARAERDYPVCLHVYGPVSYDECNYQTLAQCAPAAIGLPAQCLINPFYAAPATPPHRRRAR